jgi:hypothetical protein
MSNASIPQTDDKVKPGDYAVVIATSQHSFGGTVLWTKGNDVMLAGARSLPWWMSHMMLTDLAQNGLDEPWRFRLPAPVDKMLVVNAAVVVHATEKARESLTACPHAAYDKPMAVERPGVLTESYTSRDTYGT